MSTNVDVRFREKKRLVRDGRVADFFLNLSELEEHPLFRVGHAAHKDALLFGHQKIIARVVAEVMGRVEQSGLDAEGHAFLENGLIPQDDEGLIT
jgi:hypothetical protein